MPKPKESERPSWTASQVVAHNLTRARELRRLTQVEVADRLTRFTGTPWSQATVAQAEGSVSGTRIRQFTANELVALARAFDLPLVYFFMPPEDAARRFTTADSTGAGLPWEYLLMLVWGHRANFPVLADRAAPWAHASPSVTVPVDDLLETSDDALVAHFRRDREPYSPDDMLAAAFYGLARRRMRGSMRPGEEVEALAAGLRGLADALSAFNNYRPGTFLDPDEIGGSGGATKRKGRK